jgi:hypothetical protein
VWEGYQKKPDKTNRYGYKKVDNYYPCKLIKEIPFDAATKEVMESLEK